MRCSECKRSCEVRVEDHGYGAGEFWGTKYNDVRLVNVSSCCEAELEDKTPLDSEALRMFRQADLDEYGEDLQLTDAEIRFVDELYCMAEKLEASDVYGIDPYDLIERFYVKDDPHCYVAARESLFGKVVA